MPRFATATVTELSQIGLLRELPGEQLTKLAKGMRRGEVAAGSSVVLQGEEGDGDGEHAVAEGLAIELAQRNGEVALTMDVPRPASVTALTPTTLASCDRATFDEFLRPLFADD